MSNNVNELVSSPRSVTKHQLFEALSVLGIYLDDVHELMVFQHSIQATYYVLDSENRMLTDGTRCATLLKVYIPVEDA